MAYHVAMRRVISRVSIAILALPVGVASLGGSCSFSPDLSMSGQPCGMLVCEKSGVTLTATLPATRAEVSALEIEVCKNAVCVRTTATLAQGGTSFVCDAFGPLATTCRVTPTEPGATSELSLRFLGKDANFVDGDHYVVHVARPGEQPIYALTKQVTYSEARPNGPSCDPLCRFSTL